MTEIHTQEQLFELARGVRRTGQPIKLLDTVGAEWTITYEVLDEDGHPYPAGPEIDLIRETCDQETGYYPQLPLFSTGNLCPPPITEAEFLNRYGPWLHVPDDHPRQL